jgi:rubrerythrin
MLGVAIEGDTPDEGVFRCNQCDAEFAEDENGRCPFCDHPLEDS